MADSNAPEDDVKQETSFEVEQEQPKIDESTDEEASSEDTADENAADNSDEEPPIPKDPNRLQKFWASYKSKKKLSTPLTILALAAILLGIPATRYPILGMVIKQDVQFSVTDSTTHVPISGAEVTLGSKTAKTDGEGKATVKAAKLGKTQAKVAKKYYNDFTQNITVGLKKPASPTAFTLEATGRQVPIHIINKITGANLAGVTLKVSDTEAQTDKNGEATLVLPADKSNMDGMLTLTGYNNLGVKVTVSQLAVKENTFALTPAGKVYFLSKKTGKIDVVKSDLDGSNRQTVLAGTGSEEDTNTVLLASRDWKYLALQSRREGDKPRLYLIDTSSDKLTEMDSGDAAFTPVGWHDHDFVYKVFRNNVLAWQSKGSGLKAYNAENQQLTTIDETQAEGSSVNDYAGEILENVYILKGSIVYTKRWLASYSSVYRLAGKRMSVYSVKPNGANKQLVKDFDIGNNGYISAVLSEPEEVYFSVTSSSTTYYAYKDDKLAESKDVNAESFSKFYATFLQSPSGQSTFWYEPRDGKNSLFTGNASGEGGKEIASLSEFIPYGWYSDDYLLVSKSSSELYILPAGGTPTTSQILKITDYHKPAINFAGYGGGYGGQ